MTFTIPLSEVAMPDSDVEAVLACLRSGWLSLGPRVKAFEAALAAWTGSPHAICVSSGTAALHLACQAVGVTPGDEVIVPPVAFVATAHAPRYCGAETVFADVVSVARPVLDAADVEQRLTARTKAAIAVHPWGYTADMGPLRDVCDAHGVRLIEDAGQAMGASETGGALAGTVGDLGCVSFHSKQQLCTGEGGLVLTADDELAARVRSLRSHAMTSGTWDRHRGHSESYDIVGFGNNFRMDEPRAALGLARLPRLHADIEARRAAVRAYRARLAGVGRIAVPFSDGEVGRASHYAFALLCPSRQTRSHVRAGLAERGIQTTFYPVLHGTTEYSRTADRGTLPNAEATGDRHLCLPLWPGMPGSTIETVCAAVEDVLASL